MPTEIFLLLLLAAAMHASWNALVKSNSDRLTFIKVMSEAQIAFAVCLLPFVGLPEPTAWPYVIASAILSTGYMLLLNRAYHTGDLSLVYPLARGVAPLVVAVISLAVLGEQLSGANQCAVLLIGTGITSLALTRGPVGRRDPHAVFLALTAGCLLAGYTTLDGLGARASGSANGYMAAVSIVAPFMTICCVVWLQRGRRIPVTRQTCLFGITSGLVSYAGSWLVVWAYTLAPIALVSALRETGIVFAVIIGVVFLKERLNFARLASIAMTLCGTTLLKFGR